MLRGESASLVLTYVNQAVKHDTMAMATWRVIDRGTVPLAAKMIPFDCPGCGSEAALPVVGSALAQLAGGGLVFDGEHALPPKIQCRACRRRFGGSNVR